MASVTQLLCICECGYREEYCSPKKERKKKMEKAVCKMYRVYIVHLVTCIVTTYIMY